MDKNQDIPLERVLLAKEDVDMEKRPNVAVGVFVLNEKDEILLCKSHKWKDVYIIPGGHVKLGESVLGTVKREIKEETGLDVGDIKFLSYKESIYDPAFFRKKHFVFLNFYCRTQSMDVKLNEELQEYLWLKPEAALDAPMTESTRTSLHDLIKTLKHLRT